MADIEFVRRIHLYPRGGGRLNPPELDMILADGTIYRGRRTGKAGIDEFGRTVQPMEMYPV